MATRTPRKGRISEELLDELLAGQDAAEVFRGGELIDDLKKAVAERALDAEMDVHLGGEGERDAGNHRNGHNRKRVLTDAGSMELEVPRDRLGSFEPRLVERYSTKLIYLALRGVSGKWRGPPDYWHAARVEFAIHFGDRFDMEAS